MINTIQEDGERVNKVGFCGREWVVEGKLGLGGRRRVGEWLGHKGIAKKGQFFIDGQFKEEVGVRESTLGFYQ